VEDAGVDAVAVAVRAGVVGDVAVAKGVVIAAAIPRSRASPPLERLSRMSVRFLAKRPEVRG